MYVLEFKNMFMSSQKNMFMDSKKCSPVQKKYVQRSLVWKSISSKKVCLRILKKHELENIFTGVQKCPRVPFHFTSSLPFFLWIRGHSFLRELWTYTGCVQWHRICHWWNIVLECFQWGRHAIKAGVELKARAAGMGSAAQHVLAGSVAGSLASAPAAARSPAPTRKKVFCSERA